MTRLPPSTSAAPALEEHHVRVVASSFLRLRPWIVGPLLVFQGVLVATSEAEPRRVVALLTATTSFVLFFVYEAIRYRTRAIHATALLRSLVLTVLGIGVGSASTGALASPLVIMLAAPSGVGFAAFGRSRFSGWLALSLGLVVGLLALGSTRLQALALVGWRHDATIVAAVIASTALLYTGVGSLTHAHRDVARALAAHGDESIRHADERLRSWDAHGAQIAHELRNPLAAMRALVEITLESAEERAHRRLTVVAAEITRLEQLVEGYRSLATSAPFAPGERRETNVAELLATLVAVLEGRAARAGIELVCAPPRKGSPPTFSLDRRRVTEAVLNLVQNAIQATPHGGHVRLSHVCASDGALEIEVRDDGVGLSPTDLARLTSRDALAFSRTDGGTGLGVGLVRAVARQHGGDLRYVSQLGVGTTATLCLAAVETTFTEP